MENDDHIHSPQLKNEMIDNFLLENIPLKDDVEINIPNKKKLHEYWKKYTLPNQEIKFPDDDSSNILVQLKEKILKIPNSDQGKSQYIDEKKSKPNSPIPHNLLQELKKIKMFFTTFFKINMHILRSRGEHSICFLKIHFLTSRVDSINFRIRECIFLNSIAIF
jgi:hypothetical protein